MGFAGSGVILEVIRGPEEGERDNLEGRKKKKAQC